MVFVSIHDRPPLSSMSRRALAPGNEWQIKPRRSSGFGVDYWSSHVEWFGDKLGDCRWHAMVRTTK